MQPETRQKIVSSFMELVGELPWRDVTWEKLSERAGVSLRELRGAYDTRFGVLEDFARSLDEGLLDSVDPDMVAEGVRERLFDMLFSRLDALTPYKAGIRGLAKAARRDPALALALNGATAISMSWMLTAAGIPVSGPAGTIRAQALALAWAQVLRTWLDESDPALPRTMADLDRQLRRLERAAVRLNRFFGDDRRNPRPEPGPPAASELAEGHPS